MARDLIVGDEPDRIESGGRVRVLHTIAGLAVQSGGTSRAVVELTDVLARCEDIYVCLFSRSGSTEDLIPSLNPAVQRIVCASRSRHFGKSASFSGTVLRRMIVSAEINVVHSHGLWLPFNHAVSLAAREARSLLLVQPHGMLEPWALNHRAWKKRMAWWLYQRRDLEAADALVATSDKEAINLRRLGLRQPIAVLPHGVDIPRLTGDGIQSRTDRVVLLLSRIHPVKGLLAWVAAWKKANPQGWRVVVAGPDEGGYRKVVEAAVRSAGLEASFQFVGPVENESKTALFRTADLFALPSFSENFGVVVAEALAHALPVITTKGTPWEGLQENRCGWWVDIGVEPLTAAIRQATSLSEEERQAIGRRGRAYVEREFGWPGIAEQMLSVYRWVLGQGPKPGCVVTD